MLNYNLKLKDILFAIEKTERALKNIGENELKKDSDLFDAIVMRMQVIGESTYQLPPRIREKYNNIKWDSLIKMRNIISHAYFIINPKIVLDFTKNEMPKLKKIIQEIIKDENKI